MSPQNNIERRAARVLASHEGTKYTEALRKVRSSRMNPTDIIRDPASVGNRGPSREEAIEKISRYLLHTYLHLPPADVMNGDLTVLPELTVSRYSDEALHVVLREVDAHRKYIAANPDDSHRNWPTLTAVMEGRPETYLKLMKEFAPIAGPAATVAVLEGMTLDPRIGRAFEEAVEEKHWLIGLAAIFRVIIGFQRSVPGEDNAETSKLLRYVPRPEPLRPRPALTSSLLTFFLLVTPDKEIADGIVGDIIDFGTDDVDEILVRGGWRESMAQSQEFTNGLRASELASRLNFAMS